MRRHVCPILQLASTVARHKCRLRRLPSPLLFSLPRIRRTAASTATRSTAHRDKDGESVAVTAARLEQLLEAEITSLALREAEPLSLQQILDLASDTDLGEMARLLHDELPVRFAQRIKMLEELPGWKDRAPIACVREMYVTSFKELRMADPDESVRFMILLRKIKNRHMYTTLLVSGFKDYAELEKLLGRKGINEWLDNFFTLRVSTNMLMSHYLHIAESREGRPSGSLSSIDCPSIDPKTNPYRGSIDPHCNIASIARHAADLVTRMCVRRYGIAPEIILQDNGAEAFSFVPRYLFYIFSELLKNSVRATVEAHVSSSAEASDVNGRSSLKGVASNVKLPPVRILISGDEHFCCCRVSDEGGGIPIQDLSQVWSYFYTTAEPVESPTSRLAVDAPADMRMFQQEKGQDCELTMSLGSPLAGLGCGLPLSRLYASYLGGTIELQTMPKYGTDVFIYLSRLAATSERFSCDSRSRRSIVGYPRTCSEP
eukprot:TRINITY_DN72846_c0_g1_i1.p1 TRINITY_DN72846_c0_g1~~TRINITY_DN72846_c0_g1_i1.p1  ORF type:complete len:488 (-),score=46.89 TRINITY_DN72846_c0_g1_i1:66-1529(-)